MIVLKKAGYAQKDEVKAKGARWNGNNWYVPEGKNVFEFTDYMDDATLAVVEHFKYEMDMMQIKQDNLARKLEYEQRQTAMAKEEAAFYKKLLKDTQKSTTELLSGFSNDPLHKSVYKKPDSFKACHYTRLGLPDDFVVIDTETTGLGKDDEVVELSVLDSSANELYHSFFKPGKSIHPAASEKTGIYTHDLQASPSFASEWPKILAAIDSRPIAGHNITFDKRLIEQTLTKQTGRDCHAECDKLFDGCIDSLRIATEMGVTKGGRSLEKICDQIGVENPPNHRASHDCLGVLYVLQHFEQSLEKQSSRRVPEVGSSLDDEAQFGG